MLVEGDLQHLLLGGWLARKSERVVGPLKPGNSGEGKGPYFRQALEEDEER